MSRNACAPAVLRPLLAAAAVVVVAGCAGPAVSPPPPTTPAPSVTTAAPSTASPAVPAAARATGTAAGPSPTHRATRAATTVNLANFAGTWTGHERTLTVSASGSAHETAGFGCCTPEIDMTFRLSNPRGVGSARATATATVTGVALWAAAGPKPAIGQTGTVTLVDGVLTDSLGEADFCDRAAQTRSACGA